MAPRKMLKMSHQKKRVPMRRSMLLRLGHLPSHSAHLPHTTVVSCVAAVLWGSDTGTKVAASAHVTLLYQAGVLDLEQAGKL